MFQRFQFSATALGSSAKPSQRRRRRKHASCDVKTKLVGSVSSRAAKIAHSERRREHGGGINVMDKAHWHGRLQHCCWCSRPYHTFPFLNSLDLMLFSRHFH